MDTPDKNEHVQKKRLCKTAAWAALVVFFGLFTGLFLSIWEESGGPLLANLVLLVFFACSVVGIVLGIIGYHLISKSKRVLRGKVYAAAGIAVPLIVIFPTLLVCPRPPSIENANRILCNMRLQQLGMALKGYALENNGNYPTAGKWCDLLLSGNYIEEEELKYIRHDGIECFYAINPKCEPNSPNDVVLVFESKGSQNNFGGPELLDPNYHEPGGCNILFNDGCVKFIKKEGLGELKWNSKDFMGE